MAVSSLTSTPATISLSQTDFSVVSTPPARRNGIDTATGSKHWLRRGFRSLYWLTMQIWGLFSLAILLAILAALPVINLFVLGVLLRAGGEVSRTGKFQAGFPLLPSARRWGGMLLGCLLFLLPLSYLGSFTADARLIDPNSLTTIRLRQATFVAACILFVHLTLAVARGGRFADFFRPWKNLSWLFRELQNRTFLRSVSLQVSELCQPLQFWSHLKLGFLGACGVLMWTVLPTTLYALAETSRGPAVAVTLLGGVLLSIVLCWLPILQARFAGEERFSAYYDWKTARTLFGRSPCLWTLAFLAGYGVSLLLYLFKVVAPPRDALWMLTLLFILAIYPARLFSAWVYAYSSRRERPAWYGWRWVWSLVSFALCGFYVLLLFFTSNIGMYGKLVLYEQPFLLIPSPF